MDLRFLKDRNFIGLCVGYFLINITLYVYHTYNLHFIVKSLNFKLHNAFLLSSLIGFRFVGAFTWSMIADSTEAHRIILTISYIGFLISKACLFGVSKIDDTKSPILYYFLFLSTFLLTEFFNAGIYPIYDALCLNYISNMNLDKKKFGIMKLCGTLGHLSTGLIGNVIALCSDKNNKEKKGFYEKNVLIIKVLNGFFYIPFFLITIVYFIPSFKREKNEKKGKKENFSMKEVLSTLTNNVSYLFYIFCFTVFCLGFNRCAMSDTIVLYLNKEGVKLKDVHLIQSLRCFYEILFYFVAHYIESYLPVELIYGLSLFGSFFRGVLYAFVDLKNKEEPVRRRIVYLIDILKAFYSSMLGYSSGRIARSFINEKNESLLSGIFYGSYNGISYLFYYLYAYLVTGVLKIIVAGSEFKILFVSSSCLSVFGMVIYLLWLAMRRRRAYKNKLIKS